MKPKLFQSVLFIVLCLAFFGGNTTAQTIIVNDQLRGKSNWFKSNIDLSQYDKRVLRSGMEMFNEKRNSFRTQKSEADDYATVTFKFQYDKLKYWPDGAVIVYGENIDRTVFYADYDYEQGICSEAVCQLPKGYCDVLSVALPFEDGREAGGIVWKVMEQIKINQDTTIIIDYDDCVNQYNLKTIKPNGEEAKLDIYKRNENYEIEDTIKGNINSLADNITLIFKGTGMIMNYRVILSFEWYGQNLASTVFMNNVSDRYKLGVLRMISDNSELYVNKYETQTMSEHLLQNDASNYIIYQEKFTPSLSNNQDGQGVMRIDAQPLIENTDIHGPISYGPVPVSDCMAKVYIDAAQGGSNEEGKFEILVRPIFGDKVKTEIYSESWEDENGELVTVSDTFYYYSEICGLPIMISSNQEIEYVNTGYDDGTGYVGFHVPEGGGDIKGYPGHPRFSYYRNQKTMDYGANCPINVVCSSNYIMNQYIGDGVFAERKSISIKCNYLGRYGEVRNVDCDTLQTEIRYNDELICNDYNTKDWDLYTFISQGNPDGEITAHFVNCNMMVDGMQGMNVTDIYFDQRLEDWTAPTLQMLLFKDAEGNIIDRFETAEEGILEFAGGDFNYNIDRDTYMRWFDCKPQTVEVSYSPYSTDDWTPLEVDEIPEEYYMPGFGYFYRGSLKDVTGRGENGWFDLKIKLTDLSGNWQEQVISPAFRIGDGSQTGVEAIMRETATEVARYTIDGRSLSAPQTGVNIIKMSDGSVKKVLVK